MSSIHNLRMCHAVVTRDPPNMVSCENTRKKGEIPYNRRRLKYDKHK
jgi:hypothetical protein